MFLCLIILFSVIQKPLEASAVVAELGAGVLFALASACVYLGVTIATDKNGQKAISDFFYSLPENLQNFFEQAGKIYKSGYTTIFNWTRDGWQQFAHCVEDYFKGADFSIQYGNFELNNDNGWIGFTDDSKWTIQLPNDFKQIQYNTSTGYIRFYNQVPGTVVKNDDWYTVNFYDTWSYSGLTVSNNDGIAFSRLYLNDNNFNSQVVSPSINNSQYFLSSSVFFY